ncbi:conjugal transfer protein TraO [Flavobacterium sp. UBA6031]|uniref:conjugal transfer protein TraO n=1 Tax=Flavobacterium sp. UBA6031 TaxID=1946551 RepID=UPI0025BA2A4B|nr:conjugal transfer protein TraO [Flavobacterium sp. UBA6031]
MKKTFLLILALASLFEHTNAQRYLPGQQGIQLTVGTVNGINPQRAFYSGIAISTYTQNDSRWVFGAEFLQKQLDYEQIKIPVAQFTGEGSYFYSFLSDPSKTLLLSIGASGLAGYETSNWGNKTLFDGATLTNQDAFIYGGALTLELETFITDRIILLVNARERVLWGSSVGKFSTQLGTGVKIIIN